MTFVPEGFAVPAVLETGRFRLRPITIQDVVKDYDAVMTSRERLWTLFGEAWNWPQKDLSLRRDLLDLEWHQKEFRKRSSFDYAVMSLDERRLLGCVYVDPPEKEGYDAEVCFWVRSDELGTGLEDALEETVRRWIPAAWPFAKVAYPGRDVPWSEWNTLPDRKAA